MKSINWDAHALALGRGMHNRVNLTKLVHDLMPTNHMVSRFDPDRRDHCPSCSNPGEDRDHVIRCHAPARAKWRSSSLVAIRKLCDQQDTRPYLTDILIDGLFAWYNELPLDENEYPDIYRTLILQQNAIGWRQLFNGRMSSQWATLQEDHLWSTEKMSKTRSGKLWTTAIITGIWQQWEILWKLRNGVIFGHDEESRRKAQRELAEAKIRRVYELRQHMLPRDRDYLFDTVAEHLRLSTTSLVNWYQTYQPLFTHSVQQAKSRAIHNMRSLRSYFQTDNPNP
jgi:hypothetical protein